MNTNWKPGAPSPAPNHNWKDIDPSELDPNSIYRLLIGSIVPRPIALVSTVSSIGAGNLAPFSYFNGVASNPPSLMISIAEGRYRQKDTLSNILDTKEFVVNVVSDWFIEAVNYSSGDFESSVDELKLTGLHSLDSKIVKPVRVKEAAIHMEAKLLDTLKVGSGPGSSTLVVGEIVQFHFSDHVYHEGTIDIGKLRPVSRLGGKSYGMTSGVFDLPRPKP